MTQYKRVNIWVKRAKTGAIRIDDLLENDKFPDVAEKVIVSLEKNLFLGE